MQTPKQSNKFVYDQKESFNIHNFDYNSLRIAAFSDSAFTNNVDLKFQIGRVVLLKNDTHSSTYESLTSQTSSNGLHILYYLRKRLPSTYLFDDEVAIQKNKN